MPDIRHQFPVKAPSTRVFEVFTSPEGLNAWWTLRCSGQPLLNGEYNFYFGPAYDWNARVLDVQPGRSLTWQMTNAMDDWMNTQVGFQLQEENGITQVKFFHVGWREANDHFAITTFCWGQLLNGLKQYIEAGIIIPFEKRN